MRLSWSLLRLYERCPYAAKLMRIDKVRPDKDSQKRFITGTAGHRFLQRWHRRGFDHKTKPWEAGVIVDGVAAQEGIEWNSQSERSRFKWRSIKEASLLMKAVRHHGLDELTGLELERRLPAPLPGGSHSIAGVADMVVGDGLWFLEMKMSSDPRWTDPDQLVFYGLLFQLAEGRVPERLSFFLPVNRGDRQVVDVAVTQESFDAMQSRVRNVIIRWTQGDFQASGNAEVCSACEARRYCRSGVRTMTGTLFGDDR